MSMHELFDQNGDTGMLVVGVDDMVFRNEADTAGHPDQRLITVHNPKDLLDPETLRIAAQGRQIAPSLGSVALGI